MVKSNVGPTSDWLNGLFFPTNLTPFMISLVVLRRILIKFEKLFPVIRINLQVKYQGENPLSTTSIYSK
jgi:hypothetical protein